MLLATRMSPFIAVSWLNQTLHMAMMYTCNYLATMVFWAEVTVMSMYHSTMGEVDD